MFGGLAIEIDDFKKCIDFILEADKLKNIFRRSKLIHSSRFENDAEHSWHICIMAYTLHSFYDGEGEAPNISRAVKMLLLHDIIEVYAGDTYCYDAKASEDKFEREQKAADEIFGLLPEDLGIEFKNLWKEFDEEKTADAIFASIMDKLQPFLLNYENDGTPWLENRIKKSQVVKRMSTVIEKAGPIISAHVTQKIEDAVSKGWLIDE